MKILKRPFLKSIRHRQLSRGQSFVELALVVPILLLILLGVVEVAFFMGRYLDVLDLTREAARFASGRSPYLITALTRVPLRQIMTAAHRINLIFITIPPVFFRRLQPQFVKTPRTHFVMDLIHLSPLTLPQMMWSSVYLQSKVRLSSKDGRIQTDIGYCPTMIRIRLIMTISNVIVREMLPAQIHITRQRLCRIFWMLPVLQRLKRVM